MTGPCDQDLVYGPLLGKGSALTGASLQNHWDVAHQRVLKWRRESTKAGKPWVVANDEQGDAALGAPPDPGFEGFSGWAKEKEGREYDLHDIRRYTLWGTLMAGGAGVYLPKGGTADLDLTGAPGSFTVAWLDPRKGGPLQRGSVSDVAGGASVSLGAPPAGDDWLAVVRR